MNISIDYLNEMFQVIDGVLIWKERPESHFKTKRAFSVWNSRFSGKPSGRVNHGYWQTRVGNKIYRNHRIIYAMMRGIIPNVIDHIDGNTLNNRIENLRNTNVSGNAINCKVSVLNTSGRKGVYFHKSIGKWTASIRINGKLSHIGTFDNINDAIEARSNAEKTHYGELSREQRIIKASQENKDE